jgi:hypothetical protein
MGNPVITKLGKNQLWYKKWYTDFSYSSKVKIIKTIEAIIEVYFKYGFFFVKNLFIHDYWYKKFYNIKKFYNKEDHQLNLYFRRYYYSHKTLTIEHTYLLRNSTAEYFPLRLYVLKYLNWFIFSIQWFKPSKISENNYSSNNLNLNSKILLNKGSIHRKKPSIKGRLKLIMFLFKKLNINNNKINYVF